MVALVIVAVLAALAGGAFLYAKYGKKAQAAVEKVDQKVDSAAKAVESDVKKVL